jgi:PAS domain S-box-containing protein
LQHGYDSAQELIGREVNVLLGQRPPDSQRAQFRDELERKGIVRHEMEIERRDGSKFWVGFSTSPLRDAAGAITHLVTLGADITARLEADRKERELRERLYDEMREREQMAIELRLAQKLESVGRLAAGIAHEINTPIQYVADSAHFVRSAFNDLARLFYAYREAMGELGEKATHRLAALQTLEGADRVASIVRAMKEFSHPDSTEQAAADINHALTTMLTVSRNEYKYAANVTTQLGELPAVICNIGELNQVFLNLIVNAAHAIGDSRQDASTGRITITTRHDGECVEVLIADNGCGIAAENLEKIFDPFYTTKEVGRGTGQGLSLARTIIVDRHDGSIDVHSRLGSGTTFVVRLPLQGVVRKADA